MIRLLFVVLIALVGTSTMEAQSWRNHVKLAEKLSKDGKYLEAGEHYLSAWRQKQKKKKLAYLAGKNFMRIKDYQKAADAFKHVKDAGKDFPMIGLEYARALKQNGRYDDANREFVYFISSYGGDNAVEMNTIVQNEIRGCELAMKAAETVANSPYEIGLLSSKVNTKEIEYAPIPFSDDILYYSSTVSGDSKIYRSQMKNGEWSKPAVSADIAKKVEKKHFGNGTFTPDRKRFYFTQCDGIEGNFSHCEIYVMKNRNNRWSKPIRLPDYINEEDYTATHPYVVFDGDKEILYFASDRPGGKGGLDLWFVERDKDSKSMDFEFPKNLGGRINTFGDEVSPFYQDGILYFSSNGQVTLGGLDVFKSEGNRNVWRRPENMGQPFNSNADDWFFALLPGQKDAGYLASNRVSGSEKITTTHEDLFVFSMPIRDIVAKGKVKAEDGRSIRNAKVTLYEILKNGQKRLLHTSNFPKGEYEFALIPGKKYRVEAKKSGFELYSYEFDTNVGNKSNYGETIALETVAPATAKPNDSAIASVDDKVLPPSTPMTKPAKTDKTIKVSKEPSTKSTIETKPKVVVSEKVNTSTKVVTRDTYTPPTTIRTAPTTVYKPVDKPYTPPRKVITTPSKTVISSSTSSVPTYNRSISINEYGDFYAVQVDAPVTFVEDKYNALKSIGNVQYQYMPKQNVYRVLITEFYSKADARRAMKQAHAKGFKRAFMAHYNSGNRKYLGR